MIQRQRAHRHDLLAFGDLFERRLVPGFGLQQVGHQVAVQQHRPLAHPRGAAGVLQHRHIVRAHRGGAHRAHLALFEGRLETHGLRQRKRRHQLALVAHHVVHQGSLDQAQQVAHGRQHDVACGYPFQHLLQRGRKVLQDDDGLRTRVLELVLQLAWRVQRIHVHNHIACPQDACHGHRVLRHVGQHHGHAVAGGQPQGLKISRHGARPSIDLGKAVALAHEHIGILVGVGAQGMVHQLDQRGIKVGLHLRRNTGGVLAQPRLVHVRRTPACGAQIRRILWWEASPRIRGISRFGAPAQFQ